MIEPIKKNEAYDNHVNKLVKPLFAINGIVYYLTQSSISGKFTIIDFTNSFVLKLDLYPIDFKNDTMNYYNDINMHYSEKNYCEPFNTNLKLFMRQNYNMMFPSFYDFIKLVICSYQEK